jgi:hypothetical protein
MATMVDSGLKPEKIKFDNKHIPFNFRVKLSDRTISMGRGYVGGGSSATTWIGGGATAMVNIGQGAMGMQGPVGVQGIQGIQGQQIIPQQFEDWQTMPVHAVITEEMIEREMRTPFQRFIHILGF